jgi:hypothetical protein
MSFTPARRPWAAFRLKVNGTVIIDHCTNRSSEPVELAGTNWLGTNVAYDLNLEYAHFTNSATVRLSWLEPGMPNKTVIGGDRSAWLSTGATGILVDSAGKIWAGCFDFNFAVRIDPDAGPQSYATVHPFPLRAAASFDN